MLDRLALQRAQEMVFGWRLEGYEADKAAKAAHQLFSAESTP
jgi:hypothetical protein